MKVYKAIQNVSAAMSQAGISKGRKNTQQGYAFRGIDDVLNVLSSALVEAGLCILPRVVSREVTERTTAKGGALFYVNVQVDFDLVSTEDGSKHTVTTYGEAMDSADKATNKAMSAAYKYLAILTFCIPTEGTPENDADFTTHDVKPLDQSRQRADWLDETAMSLQECKTKAELIACWNAANAIMKKMNDVEAVATLKPIRDMALDAIESVAA